MQIPPIIPESAGSVAPAQRKESAALNGLIQLVAGMPMLPRADPRLATIIVPPILQLSEAAVIAERNRQLSVESKAAERGVRPDRSGRNLGSLAGKSSDSALTLDLGGWLKQLSRQSTGSIRWPAIQTRLPVVGEPSADGIRSVKTLTLPGVKVESSQGTPIRVSTEAPAQELPDGSIVLPNTTTQSSSSSFSPGDEVRLLMNALVQGLAFSNLFAARNLAGWITGERLRSSAEDLQAGAGSAYFTPTPEIFSKDDSVISGVPRKLVEQWMKGIDSDSTDALETAHLLLNGKLVWQGQLADGTPMLMQRYDVWREPKKHQEPMERGVGISIETELKHRGRLKIEGRQWQGVLEIVVTGNDLASPPCLWHGWQDLVERLHERAGAKVISRVVETSGAAVDVG